MSRRAPGLLMVRPDQPIKNPRLLSDTTLLITRIALIETLNLLYPTAQT